MIHAKLVLRLTEFFDLCDLAESWSVDIDTTLEIAGVERTFSSFREVVACRDAARDNLRGYCNVLRAMEKKE